MSQSEEKEPTTTETARFQQSELGTYKIPKGKTLEIAASLLASGFGRGNSGCFVAGYSLAFTQEADRGKDKYLPFRTLGIQGIKEISSKIASFKRPEQPIELYEYEACPYCRKVREAASILDLDVMYYPTPTGAPHHRTKVRELGGKELFPYMIDPNTGKSMYESDDIVVYLFNEYGDGKVPLLLRLGSITTIGGVNRPGRGMKYRKAKYPEKPLVLWGYEVSPFTKLVTEVLAELELPYKMIYCARGSPKRQRLFDRVGAFQAPFLEDPNTGVSMFESDKIVQYLDNTYAL